MELAKHKNDLLFIPMGGAGEIGLNLNLYHYRGKILIVDLGAGFADETLPGVDMIVPDINFLVKNKKNILGLVLTHIHEDHLGGVQYLWDELRCPIYTTAFTANFLRHKLTEMHFRDEVPITTIESGARFSLDPFDVEMVPITHSTPEMHALVIRTERGNILHTGDWKFDHDPLIGDITDEALLKRYGDEGILAMVGDSTNVFNAGISGSEGDLRKSLSDLIPSCENLVVVTTFASNVARLETIIKAAENCGRRVVLAGRSIKRVVKTAQESRYLLDIEPCLEEKEIGKYPKGKVLVLCTGCQGEPLAAAAKIATKSHPNIKLATGDTIIFSSKIIPGNEKKIYRLFNQFVKMGVEVLTEKDHFVHVSGHPARDELKRMYELVRPRIAIPVHGELVHMHEHASLAKEMKIKHAIQVENGDVVKLDPDSPEKLGRVHVGYLAIDGNCLLPYNSPVMQMRRKIQRNGVVVVSLVIDDHGLATRPIVAAPGILDRHDDRELLNEIANDILNIIEENPITGSRHKKDKKTRKINKEVLTEKAKEIVRKIIRREVGKNPPIEIYIEKIY